MSSSHEQPKLNEVNIPLKYANKESDCYEVGVLYEVYDQFIEKKFILKYENAGQVFKIILESANQKGEFYVTLKTDKYGDADLEGMNVFAYTSNLKRMVNSISAQAGEVKSIKASHLSKFLTAKQVDVLREYLVSKNQLKLSDFSLDVDYLPEMFLRACKGDKKISGEFLKLRNLLSSYKKDWNKGTVLGKEAEEKRYKLFLTAIKRSFKGPKIEIVNSEKDKSFCINFK